MIGPDAIDCNREEINTTMEGQKDIDRASLSIKQVPYANQITSFAGLRAHNTTGDFIIKEDLDNPGYFDVAGIESPGLTSAPKIGKYVYDLVDKSILQKLKENFNIKYRKGITKVMELPLEKRNQLIAKNPLYGQIVCFCENVSAGEIIEAINRPLSPTTIDGLKRRIRVGDGKMSIRFCLNKSMKLLSQELNKDIFTITKNGKHSTYLVGLNKEVNHE